MVKDQLETDAQPLVTEESVEKGEVQEQDEGAVKYSTHKKLLSQLKSSKSELDELKEFKRQTEEERALKRGEFEKILKAREERIQELEGKLTHIDKDLTDGTKLNAFLSKLPGKVKRQEYLSFVDLDSIAVDPDTKEIDQVSLEREAKKFVDNFSDLLVMSTKKTLPSVNNLGGGHTPSTKKNLKSMTREELRQAYLNSVKV